MNKRIIFYSAGAAAPLLALALVSAPALAASGTAAKGFFHQRIEPTAEQKAVLEQVRELHKQGKREEAHALLESSGFAKGKPFMIRLAPDAKPGSGPLMKKEPFHLKVENAQAIRDAIKNNDFVKFQELTKDMPLAANMDEATFAKIVEAHKNGSNPGGDFKIRFHKGFRIQR